MHMVSKYRIDCRWEEKTPIINVLTVQCTSNCEHICIYNSGFIASFDVFGWLSFDGGRFVEANISQSEWFLGRGKVQ